MFFLVESAGWYAVFMGKVTLMMLDNSYLPRMKAQSSNYVLMSTLCELNACGKLVKWF